MSLIVVQYFYDSFAFSLAKIQLETEGINVIARDELSLQVYGVEARAMGGAKLLVDKKDYAKASNILIEGGFMVSNDTEEGSEITHFLDRLAHIVPGSHQLPKELRIVMAAFVLISIPIGLAFFLLV